MNRFLLAFTIFWLVSQANCNPPHRFRHRSSSTRCRKCVPGWGVVSMCTAIEDTVCERCPPGYYSQHHSDKQSCSTCSRCGEGLYVAHACSETRDTICDSCATFRGPRNEDFVEKCSNRTVVLTEKYNDDAKEFAPNSTGSGDRLLSSPTNPPIEPFRPKSLFLKMSKETVDDFTTETKEKTREFSAKDATQKNERGDATAALRSTLIAVGPCVLILLFAALVKNLTKRGRPSTSTYGVLPEAS